MITFRWTALAVAAVFTQAAAIGTIAAKVGPKAPASQSARANRQRFLEMFARAYFRGRTGQLLVVPKEGDFITRRDPYYVQMHGTPWPLRCLYSLDVRGPCGQGGAVLDGRGATGRRADARRRAGCPDAADRDRTCPAGPAKGFPSPTRGHAAGSGWHAPRLLRSQLRSHAHPHGPAPPQRLVHSGSGQLHPHERRRRALDDLDGRGPWRARN